MLRVARSAYFEVRLCVDYVQMTITINKNHSEQPSDVQGAK